jgi:hypothetical protein
MVEQNLRLAGGSRSSAAQAVARKRSLDAPVRRRHPQTPQLDLDNQDSRFSPWKKVTVEASRMRARQSA